MDRHSRVLLGLSIGLVTAGGLAGCGDSQPDVTSGRRISDSPDRVIVRMMQNSAEGEADIWQDQQTGCQYLSYGRRVPEFTLRYTVDGKPWCGLPPAQQRGRPEGVQP